MVIRAMYDVTKDQLLSTEATRPICAGTHAVTVARGLVANARILSPADINKLTLSLFENDFLPHPPVVCREDLRNVDQAIDELSLGLHAFMDLNRPDGDIVINGMARNMER